MANEFKIKNALLIEGSTNSQRVVAIRDSSLEITSDASSLLVTAKAIHDYVSSVAGDSYWELDGSSLKPKDDTVNVELSAIQVDTDAGEVTLVDMDVSSAGSGVPQSYSFNIDGEPIAKIYAEGDGAGGTREEKLVSTKTFVAESSVYFTGIGQATQTKVLYYNPISGIVSYQDPCVGGISSVAWGDISGNLKDQTDVSTAIDAKQNKLTFGNSSRIPYSNGVSDFNYDASFFRSSELFRIDLLEFDKTSASTSIKHDSSTVITFNIGNNGGTVLYSYDASSNIQIYPNNTNFNGKNFNFSLGTAGSSFIYIKDDYNVTPKTNTLLISSPTDTKEYLSVKSSGSIHCASIGESIQSKVLYYNTGTKEITYGDPSGGVTPDVDKAYVDGSLNLKAPLASPTFTGTVTIPQTADDASYTGIVTNDSGVLKYRTKAEILSDIDAVSLSTAQTITGQKTFSANILANASGTAALPAYSFSSDANTGMYRISEDTLGFSTNGTERMRIIPTGEVGFGKTPASGYVIDVAGKIAGSSSIELQRNTSSTYLPVMVFADTLGGAKSDNVSIGNAGGGAVIMHTTNAERMRINGTGEVGIGKTAATNIKLDVEGRVIRVGGSESGAYYVANGANTLTAYGDRARIIGGTIGQEVMIWGANVPLTFYINSAERMRINATGEVGIGKTADSGVRLDVSGLIRGTEIVAGVGSAASPSYRFTGDGNTGFYWEGSDKIGISTNGTKKLEIDSTGRMNLYSSATYPFVFYNGSGTQKGFIGAGGDNWELLLRDASNNNKILLQTGEGQTNYLVNNLNIGGAVSSSTPSKLTVVGDVSISASIYASGLSSQTSSNVIYYQSDGKLTYGAAPSGGGGGNVSWKDGSVGMSNYIITANGDGSIAHHSAITWNPATRILDIVPGNALSSGELGSARLGMANKTPSSSAESDYLYSGFIVLGQSASQLGQYAMGFSAKSYRPGDATYTYSHVAVAAGGSLYTKYNANATDSIAASGGTWRLHPYITGNANDRILTATGSGDINGEANLRFNGSRLDVIGDASISGNVTVSSSSYHYMGDANTNGSWRWFINGDGDLEFQKRVAGTWTSKGKFS